MKKLRPGHTVKVEVEMSQRAYMLLKLIAQNSGYRAPAYAAMLLSNWIEAIWKKTQVELAADGQATAGVAESPGETKAPTAPMRL